MIDDPLNRLKVKRGSELPQAKLTDDGMNGKIEVRLNVSDAPVHKGVVGYFEWVESECRKAGVPFTDGEPENGVLCRTDDPNDFGVEIWTYVYNAELNGTKCPVE